MGAYFYGFPQTTGDLDYYAAVPTDGLRNNRQADWWARKDLNLQPLDYESSALTD